MGVLKKLLNIDENNVFRFTVNTSKIVSGATDGSQDPLKFVLPFAAQTLITGTVILKVSDGRADVALTNNNKDAYKTLTFATAGIYDISLIGKISYVAMTASPDKLKLTEINQFGFSTRFLASAFFGCTNLIVKATDQPNLLGNQASLFRQIKGFDPAIDLSIWDFSRVTDAAYFFTDVQNPMTSVPQGFLNMANIDRLYQGCNIAAISKIEIISDAVTSAQWLFLQCNYRGRIVMKTPNLTNITGLMYGTTNPPSLGEIDIRKVTDATNFLVAVMATVNVDATLLGWQNNFDWTNVTNSTKATFDFYNSKYSNNAAVIAAKSFLESKGFTFSRLTMA